MHCPEYKPSIQVFPASQPCLSARANSLRLDCENRSRDLKSACPAVQQNAQTLTTSQEAGLAGITANTKKVTPRSSWTVHLPGNRGCPFCHRPGQRTVGIHNNWVCSRTEASLRPSYICTVSPCCRSLQVRLDSCKSLVIQQLSLGTNGAFCEFENGTAASSAFQLAETQCHLVTLTGGLRCTEMYQEYALCKNDWPLGPSTQDKSLERSPC